MFFKSRDGVVKGVRVARVSASPKDLMLDLAIARECQGSCSTNPQNTGKLIFAEDWNRMERFSYLCRRGLCSASCQPKRFNITLERRRSKAARQIQTKPKTPTGREEWFSPKCVYRIRVRSALKVLVML